MSNYASLKATINANIRENNNQEITGVVLNSVLNDLVDVIGAGYQYAGIATPTTNPGTPDNKVFYLTAMAGTYTNFGGIVVSTGEVAILRWDTSWSKDIPGIASSEDVSSLKKTLSFVGLDNNFARSNKKTIPAIPGHVYRITPFVKEWSHSNVTSSATANGFAVGYGINNDEYFLYASIVGSWVFSDYYDIKIPDNVSNAYVHLGGRANSGVVVEFSVEDITEIYKLQIETFPPIAEKSGTLVSGDNMDYVECNLIAGQTYVMYREFSKGIMNLNAGSASSSGLRIWLSNSSTATDQASTIQNIEQILYQTGAIFVERIKFTASANARYLRFFVKAKASDAGQTYVFGVGKENGQSIFDLNNSVKSLNQKVELGYNGTIRTEGVSTNSIFYFKPLGGYKYLFTFENFTKSLLSALKVQIGYYPDANNLSDSSFVVLRQINNSSSGDVDVSLINDLVFSFPDDCLGRIVLRGDAGQDVNFRIELDEYEKQKSHGASRSYDGRRLDPYGHTNKYKDVVVAVPGIATYNGNSLQGFAIYGNYAFITYDTGYIRILDMTTLTIVASYSMPEGVQNPQNHAGMANFGYAFYSADDEFPVLYVSSYLENKCYVLRVTMTGCSLVQTIEMANAWHFLVDDNGHLIVHMNNWSTYYIFNVHPINSSSVVLQAADALDSFEFVTHGMHTTGTFCQDNKMYILCYYIGSQSNGRYDRMVVYDYDAKQIISTIIFENSLIRTNEFEGMSVDSDGNIVISFVANQLAFLGF